MFITSFVYVNYFTSPHHRPPDTGGVIIMWGLHPTPNIPPYGTYTPSSPVSPLPKRVK